MLKNYLITALRNLLIHKGYAFINILGLALGITCCLLLFFVIRHELSYDTHHGKVDRIYRIVTHYQTEDGIEYDIGIPYPILPALRSDFPELKQVTMISAEQGPLVTITDKHSRQQRKFQENKNKTVMAFVEGVYFQMFNYQWLAGNPKTALQDPGSIVLTKKQAEKYFGEENAMGKTIRLNNKMDFLVTGIVTDPPSTTDFPFLLFPSFASLKAYGPPTGLDDWVSIYSEAQCYLLLPESMAEKAFEDRLEDFERKYKDAETAKNEQFLLQPLADIHFDERYGNYSRRTVSKETIWTLVFVGIFLLSTACINFINLATAQALRRSKEVGVRKALGSSYGQLIKQFLGETALITCIALSIGILLASLTLPSLAHLLDLTLVFNLLEDFPLIAFLVLLTLLTILLAGFYPAIVLASYKPVLALKGKITTNSTSSLTLRKSLLVLQFVISQTLIIGTIVAFKQMDYFRSAPLGFDKDAIITVALPEKKVSQLEALRAKLSASPNIEKFSFSMSAPSSQGNWSTSIRFDNAAKNSDFAAVMRPADTAYFATYGLELVAGRMYRPSDTIREYVVNETLLKKVGISDPQQALGKMIGLYEGSKKAPIVGVVKDFYTFSMHEETAPAIFTTIAKTYGMVSIKVSSSEASVNNLNHTIDYIRQSWQQLYPDYVFNYEFLDQTIANFYQNEERMYFLFRLFAGIAIFIGCLGLYGMIAYIAESRRKEIGIRKVLGASISNIVLLFFKQFALLVVIAFLIASPIAYYIMNGWLENFAYRIDISMEVFVIAIVSSLVIAVLTVSYRSVKAALANPVKSLRSE